MYGYNAVAMPKNVVIYARVSTEHEASSRHWRISWTGTSRCLNNILNGHSSAVMLTRVSRELRQRNVRSSCRCSVMQRTAIST